MRKKQLNFKFGAIEVHIYPKVCCIQTADGQLKIQFGNRTKEYAQIMYLAATNSIEELKFLAAFMYYTRMIISDNSFFHKYKELLDWYLESKKAPEVSKEEDDKILEEERKLYEERHDK